MNAVLGFDFPVRDTEELRRIVALPRRSYSAEELEKLAEEMTEVLRTPTGTMALRPIQALSLLEIGTVGGLFGPQRVGAGKTLVSLLAPVVMFSERPLLLVPAKLIDKTKRDRDHLEKHWQLPRFIRIMSYEWLGRVQAAEALENFQPDLIICDEAHKLKNHHAAVTRRVRRFWSQHRGTKFVVMSGTITKRSLHDFAELLGLCLGRWAPVPLNYADLELWADALDERKDQQRRADPGALIVFCNESEKKLWKTEPRAAARSAFRRRLVETKGVVATEETGIDATLTIQAVEPKVSKAVDNAFEILREHWATPDGHPLADGMQVFKTARELANGFYYKWDPRPPRDWLDARREWCSFVRKKLKHSHELDSELQVRQWASKQKTHPELDAWNEVKDDFEPNVVPVWIDFSIVNFAADWARRENGIVWVDHIVVGQRLEEEFGIPYYGKKGKDAHGRIIEDHEPGTCLVASVASNSEGRNLQGWSSNLILSAPPNGGRLEQLIGRTHRDGQQADEVSVDVVVTCAEHVGGFWQCVKDSEFVAQTTGSVQKLLVAGINMITPDELALRRGARWEKDWTRESGY